MAKKEETKYLPQDDASRTQVTIPNATGMAAMPEYINANSNRGNENVAPEDVAIPRLEIVQSLSPIRKENPNATEGQLFNSVTGEIYGEEVYVVPVTYAKQFLIWKDRKKGGGFRGAWPTMEAAKNRIDELDSNDLDHAADLTIAETPTHLCMLLLGSGDNARVEQIAIAMPRSKMKVNRKWNAAIQIAGGDRFSRVYKLGVTVETNAQGQDYYNFTVAPFTWAPQKVYAAAGMVWERVARVGMNVAHESVGGDDVDSAPAGAGEI